MASSVDHLADSIEEKLDFNHPYTPYQVQEEFMRTVYDVLENGNIGILESPTGTGKSLSLICGSLTWLRSHKRLEFDAALTTARDKFKGEPDWVVDQLLRRQQDELVRKWRDREGRLEKARQGERRQEERVAKRRRIEKSETVGGKDEVDESEWLLGNDGDDDDGGGAGSNLSKETRQMMEKLGLVAKSSMREEEEEQDDAGIKIYYTSRTHSQITQFISELRRPKFPSSLPKSVQKAQATGDEAASECVKEVPLSSRQKLCINPSVSRLGTVAAINDRCAELQKAKSKERCGFVPSADNLAATHRFRDAALATLPDIEDLHALGKTLGVCPYYASRAAIPSAEIVTLPYPLLLQRSAREALGIKLEGNVVIIDEAHNIMDAVAGVYAADIKLSELRRAREMLAVYAKRFGNKLRIANRIMIGQVARIVQGLSEWLEGAMKFKDDQGIVDSNQLMKHRGMDQVNLFKLVQYIQDSKLAFKIESYAAFVDESEEQQKASKEPARAAPRRTQTPVLHTLTSFLVSLTNLGTEGRIFYHKQRGGNGDSVASSTTSTGGATPSGRQVSDVSLSYLLLSPTHAFSSIVSSARSVILAGGTMSPMADYVNLLFPQVDSARITTLSCAHVVPRENVAVWMLASSLPRATDADVFDFSFSRRRDKAQMGRLGLALLNLCAVVPDGVVVFFPSYGFLDEVVSCWMSSDPGDASAASAPGQKLPQPPRQASIWERLQARKAVFRDGRDAGAGGGEDVLKAYSAAILGDGSGGSGTSSNVEQTPTAKGALLLSVVGGRMSEGINFSDRLGRCVVVVGLPYPNAHSPEWKARTEFIAQTTFERLTSPGGHVSSSSTDPSALASQVPSGEVNATFIPTPTPAPLAPPPSTSPSEARELAKAAARDYYENSMMRAVNQSVGRAVRHRGDFAAIVLCDRRFAGERVRAKLPGWIRDSIVEGSEEKGVPGMMGRLGGFFRERRDGGG